MSKGPETTITNNIIKAVNKLPKCKIQKVHGGPYGHPTLDLIGAVDGRMFLLEVKAPGKKPTPRQMSTMEDWSNAGVYTGWVTSVDAALDFINTIKSETGAC